MTSRLEIYCEALMEAAWLAVVVTIPLFFNISSSRMFEPDKIYVLKFLTVVAGMAWLIKWISLKLLPAERAEQENRQTSFFKLPLVIPVLALAALYTLSSVFSVLPAESWWGSYNRSQGTIAVYCYAILFLIVVAELRTGAQLRRLQYGLILTGLPVSAYSILQFVGKDFILWTDFIPGRSSGSMGNPIFLGGYLIMVIPLTFSRLADGIGMLRAEDNRRPGFVLTLFCGLTLTMELLGLLCTQSRGPVSGLIVAGYICIFIFLVLKRVPGDRGFPGPAVAVGLGCGVPVLIIAVVYMVSGLSAFAAVLWIGGSLACAGAAYVFLWRIAWGRNWLWLTWLIQTAVLLFIAAIGPARITGHDLSIPRIGRWTVFSEGSIDVRYYLWQSGYNALRSDSPDPLPDGSSDSLHLLRPAVGYGPECIWFPVNLHAPPELFDIHSGGADRMHNETFDNLLAIGFAGAVMYFFLVSAALFFSLRYMGFISGTRQNMLFAAFLVLGSGVGILVPWFRGVPQMASVGVQAGLLIGLLAYVGWRGLRSAGSTQAAGSQQVLVLCILGSVIAHFVETAVGIAVTPTRTYFFLLLGVLSVLASHRLKQSATAKKKGRKPLRWTRTPLPALIAVASFVILTEAWCFIDNITAERSAVRLFIDNWFIQSEHQRLGFLLPGNLLLLLLTVGGGIALIYAEKSRLFLSKRDTGKIRTAFPLFAILIWLVMGFLSAVFWSAGDPSITTPTDVSIHSEARMTLFLVGLLVMLGAAAFTLATADARKYAAASSVRSSCYWIGLLLAAGALIAVYQLTVRPAWADIACHVARVYERSGNSAAAIRIYERAVKLAPHNTTYLISLGNAQNSSAAPNSSQLQESINTLERAVHINPLDAFNHLQLGDVYMHIGEHEPSESDRNAPISKAISSFRQTIRLAPGILDAHNDLGRCYFLLGEYGRAGELYRESMKTDPEDGQAHMYMGEMQYTLRDLEGALQSFTVAARLEGDSIAARENIGSTLILLGRKEEAIRESLEALKLAPQNQDLLRRVSSLYFSTGNYNSGLAFARRAYDATPAELRPDFDAFLEALRNRIQ